MAYQPPSASSGPNYGQSQQSAIHPGYGPPSNGGAGQMGQVMFPGPGPTGAGPQYSMRQLQQAPQASNNRSNNMMSPPCASQAYPPQAMVYHNNSVQHQQSMAPAPLDEMPELKPGMTLVDILKATSNIPSYNLPHDDNILDFLYTYSLDAAEFAYKGDDGCFYLPPEKRIMRRRVFPEEVMNQQPGPSGIGAEQQWIRNRQIASQQGRFPPGVQAHQQQQFLVQQQRLTPGYAVGPGGQQPVRQHFFPDGAPQQPGMMVGQPSPVFMQNSPGGAGVRLVSPAYPQPGSVQSQQGGPVFSRQPSLTNDPYSQPPRSMLPPPTMPPMSVDRPAESPAMQEPFRYSAASLTSPRAIKQEVTAKQEMKQEAGQKKRVNGSLKSTLSTEHLASPSIIKNEIFSPPPQAHSAGPQENAFFPHNIKMEGGGSRPTSTFLQAAKAMDNGIIKPPSNVSPLVAVSPPQAGSSSSPSCPNLLAALTKAGGKPIGAAMGPGGFSDDSRRPSTTSPASVCSTASSVASSKKRNGDDDGIAPKAKTAKRPKYDTNNMPYINLINFVLQCDPDPLIVFICRQLLSTDKSHKRSLDWKESPETRTFVVSRPRIFSELWKKENGVFEANSRAITYAKIEQQIGKTYNNRFIGRYRLIEKVNENREFQFFPGLMESAGLRLNQTELFVMNNNLYERPYNGPHPIPSLAPPPPPQASTPPEDRKPPPLSSHMLTEHQRMQMYQQQMRMQQQQQMRHPGGPPNPSSMMRSDSFGAPTPSPLGPHQAPPQQVPGGGGMMRQHPPSKTGPTPSQANGNGPPSGGPQMMSTGPPPGYSSAPIKIA